MEQALHGLVVVAAREDAGEVEEERERDVEDEERHWHTPQMARRIGRGQRTTAPRRPAMFGRVRPKREFWYPTRTLTFPLDNSMLPLDGASIQE